MIKQVLHISAVAVEHGFLLGADRLLGYSQRDKGIAIAVTADPRAIAQKAWDDKTLARIIVGQRFAEVSIDLRDQAINGLFKIVEAIAHLIHHRHLPVARLIALPEDQNVFAQLFVQRRRFFGEQVKPFTRTQQSSNVAQAPLDHAAFGLGWMRSKDRHDKKIGQQRAEFVGAHIGVMQTADGVAILSLIGVRWVCASRARSRKTLTRSCSSARLTS